MRKYLICFSVVISLVATIIDSQEACSDQMPNDWDNSNTNHCKELIHNIGLNNVSCQTLIELDVAEVYCITNVEVFRACTNATGLVKDYCKESCGVCDEPTQQSEEPRTTLTSSPGSSPPLQTSTTPTVPTCKVETWGGQLDDTNWQASINNNAVSGVSYQVDQFYNGIGSIEGVSSARVIGSGCRVAFKDSTETILCTLSSGDYQAQSFIHDNGCGNDVVTQYTIRSAEICKNELSDTYCAQEYCQHFLFTTLCKESCGLCGAIGR